MCGILALIACPWRSQIKEALSPLNSRGPDEQNTLILPKASFGHTRLSIIDIDGGHQPMSTLDGRFHIVFNGEIYNFKDLKVELEHLGYSFKTRSDTEVLLLGWQAWGPKLLNKLDGMFAFCLWDNLLEEAIIARDPLGIKPLFYSLKQGLSVASTLSPFFHLKGFSRKINYEALRDYMAFQVTLSPHSFLQDVMQLPPGSYLRYNAKENTHELKRYWTPPKPKHITYDPEELLQKVDLALKQSVERQLVADVPLGAFLSGGIDSSLMVSYMAEKTTQSLKTFNFKFADRKFDESHYAEKVARQYGCEHHTFEASEVSGEAFFNTIATLDQPLADPAYVTTHALSYLTRSKVTVAISGDGGDELFGGYPRFLDTEDKHTSTFYKKALRKLIDWKLLPGSFLSHSLYGQELLFYRRVELGPWHHGRKNLLSFFKPDFHGALRSGETLRLWRDLIGEFSGKMDSSTLMRADLWTYLSENCLAKADRASMAHGLEVRVPLLGAPVVDLILNYPSDVHFRGGMKALLLALAKKRLPKEVWDRPKHGFSVPLGALFRGPWREQCESVMERVEELAPFLDGTRVRGLWKQTLAENRSQRLSYTLVVLLMWLSKRHVEF